MSDQIRSAAIFCGSRPGRNPAHAAAAQALGTAMAEAGLTVVYGGGGVGLMGVVAEAAIAAGGRVHGVIPEFLTRIERIFPAVAELEVTTSMHSRKTRMFELSDAFVAIPGGLGTLDELVEIITWRQLGLHDRPVIVLDAAGWAQPFVALVEALIADGFVDPACRRLFTVAADVPAVMALLRSAPTAEAAAPADRL
ncbi:TIGR00730 family Rossman fold protein [Paeniroseomonas aquatica]|uniref:Cytokinin riboside 5'-monophosphate phosphoribohydrolase n=1 Tax=Paeniroseomonas aquatica TaxID=373043 RepID=A0ABT8A1S7_9PROT|nr:TIGR00730 family Rossman fold protein [Paeniroseomonas aquatica]MDN3563489.1 TIGR00730 family Rossman fold protein [Paeniroseomonas aquatica]